MPVVEHLLEYHADVNICDGVCALWSTLPNTMFNFCEHDLLCTDCTGMEVATCIVLCTGLYTCSCHRCKAFSPPITTLLKSGCSGKTF